MSDSQAAYSALSSFELGSGIVMDCMTYFSELREHKELSLSFVMGSGIVMNSITYFKELREHKELSLSFEMWLFQ